MTDTRQISVKAETFLQTWTRTDHRCPKCGAKNIWQQDVSSPAVVLKHICAERRCGVRFLLSPAFEAPDEASEDVAKALRAPLERV